jgi:hypothetical protein
MTLERCMLLKPYLDAYKRRITILELGAGIHPFVSTYLAYHHDAVTVMVERDPIEETWLRGVPRLIWLKHALNTLTLTRLLECEYFDVVIAFNVLHWFPLANWRIAAESILQSGGDVFVQVPLLEEETAPGLEFRADLLALMQTRCTQIGETSQFPRHPARPVFHCHNLTPHLTRTHLGAHKDSADTWIESTPTSCTAHMHRLDKGDKSWVAGMNLWNFCNLHGALPARDKVLEWMRGFPLPTQRHGDITPWNFLIDGERLHLVDGFEGWDADDAEALQRAVKMVEEFS